MATGRTLVVAIDGLDAQDVRALAAHSRTTGPVALAHGGLGGFSRWEIAGGGPSEPAPALTSVLTGASVARTGVATQLPFSPGRARARSAWYAADLRSRTLLDAAREAGWSTAALQWPATAEAPIDLCLPLVEDLALFRTRWEMTERTSSSRMVREHLAPRRAAGVQLSSVPPDALVTEVFGEISGDRGPAVAMVGLTGLGAARRETGLASAEAERALADTAEFVQRLVAAHDPGPADRTVIVPGRPLVPTTLLVHPNTALARAGLVTTDGPRLGEFDAVVWPDGPRGVVHVRQGAGAAVRARALEALAEIAEHSHLTLRPVDDGVGASEQTDVVAVLEGTPGTLFGLPATQRPLVGGDDPYFAGPRAVTDPTAPVTIYGRGPGLPPSQSQGSWADLGVSLAEALGLELPGANAAGLSQPAAVAG